MTKRESAQAQRLLADDIWCDRTERCGADDAGVPTYRRAQSWCVTAHWRDGGQRLFYTLDDVRDQVVIESR